MGFANVGALEVSLNTSDDVRVNHALNIIADLATTKSARRSQATEGRMSSVGKQIAAQLPSHSRRCQRRRPLQFTPT